MSSDLVPQQSGNERVDGAMSRAMPSLNALRAFEAAARCGSFAKAAEELCVTPTAISHHIKLLESQLGVRLFERRKSGLQLTPEAIDYFPEVQQAFNKISRATSEVTAVQKKESLAISVLPTFALRWLIPRLPSFYNLYPSIEIRLMAGYRAIDFRDDTVNLAIRTEQRIHLDLKHADLDVDLLFTPKLFPVCSSDVALSHSRPLRNPGDLANHTLLHVTTSMEDWRQWLDAAQVTSIDPARGPKYDSYALALEAAAHGAGVAIARQPFVDDDLKAGRLVAPIKISVHQNRSWYLVYPRRHAADRKIELFRDWLLEEAFHQTSCSSIFDESINHEGDRKLAKKARQGSSDAPRRAPA